MRRLALIVFSVLVLMTSPALAKDGPSARWIVSQLSGDARVVHSGLQPVALSVNAQLAPGDTVVTGASGRATLARGADYIVIAPRSELRLPSAPQPNGFTRVMQNIGTMMFKVRHTGVPHFAVDTPMLAAVVKGTTFTVIVDKDVSAVQVTEGRVQVTALDGGMTQLVDGGRTVLLDHRNPKMLIDADARPAATTTSSTSSVKISGTATPSVAAIASLTGSLVRPEAAPRPTSTATTVALTSPVPAPTTPTTTAPTVEIVETAVPAATDPLVNIVETTVPAVADPVVNIVETAVPTVTEPVVNIVETTVPAVLEPVVNIVETTVPAVAEPVVNIVETTVPEVVEPVVSVVETTVPAVIEPVVNIVETTVPAVTQPVVDIVQTVAPAVTAPVQSLLGGLFK